MFLGSLALRGLVSKTLAAFLSQAVFLRMFDLLSWVSSTSVMANRTPSTLRSAPPGAAVRGPPPPPAHRTAPAAPRPWRRCAFALSTLRRLHPSDTAPRGSGCAAIPRRSSQSFAPPLFCLTKLYTESGLQLGVQSSHEFVLVG